MNFWSTCWSGLFLPKSEAFPHNHFISFFDCPPTPFPFGLKSRWCRNPHREERNIAATLFTLNPPLARIQLLSPPPPLSAAPLSLGSPIWSSCGKHSDVGVSDKQCQECLWGSSSRWGSWLNHTASSGTLTTQLQDIKWRPQLGHGSQDPFKDVTGSKASL